MLVGISQFELFIPESGSLKSKRFVLKSLKTRLKNRFNISVAEVGDTEKWQRATLGIATVADNRRFIDETLSKVYNFIENDRNLQITDYRVEIV